MSEHPDSSFMQTDEAKKLLPVRKSSSGWTIITVHHSAIPNYDYEAACTGLTYEGIRRELEID